MKRLTAPIAAIGPFAAAAAAFAGLTSLPAPAAAQEEGGDKVNTLIVYGDDECPQSTPGEITVCARLDESERFRVPEVLRQSEDPANQSWTDRVRSYETVGDFGALSCTPVGAGGELGCTQQLIEAAYAERAQAPGVRFSQLIEEARQERLSEIDAEAAATQERVEELERQYAERLRRAQEGEPEALIDPSAPPAAVDDLQRNPPAAPASDVPFEDEEDTAPQPVDPAAPARIGDE